MSVRRCIKDSSALVLIQTYMFVHNSHVRLYCAFKVITRCCPRRFTLPHRYIALMILQLMVPTCKTGTVDRGVGVRIITRQVPGGRYVNLSLLLLLRSHKFCFQRGTNPFLKYTVLFVQHVFRWPYRNYSSWYRDRSHGCDDCHGSRTSYTAKRLKENRSMGRSMAHDRVLTLHSRD